MTRLLHNPPTREEFIEAVNKYPPPRWVVFMFRYFSKSTTKEDMAPSRTILWFLIALFVAGLGSTIIGLPRGVVAVVTLSFMALLTAVGLSMLAAGFTNNRRIRRICKELDIPIWQYNELADQYW